MQRSPLSDPFLSFVSQSSVTRIDQKSTGIPMYTMLFDGHLRHCTMRNCSQVVGEIQEKPTRFALFLTLFPCFCSSFLDQERTRERECYLPTEQRNRTRSLAEKGTQEKGDEQRERCWPTRRGRRKRRPAGSTQPTGVSSHCCLSC